MTDPQLTMTIAGAGLLGLAMLVFAALAGWQGWLALKRQQLAADLDRLAPGPGQSAGARIEIADLKERIRKLEAIAAGVDL